MKKLLVICGPTATGKTSLALNLAGKLNGEIVSADSRQVYKGMDIGTGKDIPKGFRFNKSILRFQNSEIGYYTDREIRIWGYDLTNPTEEFNISDYIKIARGIIEYIRLRGNLPILVGGTGFYIQGVIDGVGTAGIKKNEKLRKSLKERSAVELFQVLNALDTKKAESLNDSDKNNPRRLIRAIEVAKNQENINPVTKASLESDNLFVGLEVSKEKLNINIRERIEQRLESGFINEIKDLVESGCKWSDKSMTATGYRQMKGYFDRTKSLEECKNDWIIAERKYAKRQMTWFRKDKRIKWFDTLEPKYRHAIEKVVARWYFNR